MMRISNQTLIVELYSGVKIKFFSSFKTFLMIPNNNSKKNQSAISEGFYKCEGIMVEIVSSDYEY